MLLGRRVDLTAGRRCARGSSSISMRLTKPRITALVVATFAGRRLAGAGRHGALARGHDAHRHRAARVGVERLQHVPGARRDRLMERTRDRPLPGRRGLARGGARVRDGARVRGAAAALPRRQPADRAPRRRGARLVRRRLHADEAQSPAALFVGAIPGAIPPLMGWTAATGHLDAPGLVLFAILFLWQIPHFLAIAIYRADDYARAGFKVLPLRRSRSARRASTSWSSRSCSSPRRSCSSRCASPACATWRSATLLGAALIGWGPPGSGAPPRRGPGRARCSSSRSST